MASGPITSWQVDGETVETVTDFILGGSKITADGDCSHEIKRCWLLGRKVMTNLDSILKSRDITLLTKVHIVKVMFFPLVMYWCERWIMKRLSAKESMPLNSVLEKTLQSPLDCKIKPVNPKENWLWIIIKRTYTEAPILWPPDAESQLIGKDPDAGKDWRQAEKWMTEDEMVRWHQWLTGHEFEQTLGDGEDRKTWRAAVHGVTKSQTWLSNWITNLLSNSLCIYEHLFI